MSRNTPKLYIYFEHLVSMRDIYRGITLKMVKIH